MFDVNWRSALLTVVLVVAVKRILENFQAKRVAQKMHRICADKRAAGALTRQGPLPAVDLELQKRILSLKVDELSEQISSRKLRAVDVVATYLHKSRSVNERLNCVTEEFTKRALDEAAKVDAAPSRLGPLHGVPFSVKDCLNVAGFDSTVGSAIHCFDPKDEDAVHVALLRAAGAIPIVHTNVSQCMMLPESDNYVWGRTLNPHDLKRTPGGSSGGEAALVSAGGSLFGIGTDIGGSIRIPAHFCGVFGFKPTPGRMTAKGATIPRRKGMEYSQTLIPSSPGPLANRVTDCVTVCKIWFSQQLFRIDASVPPIPWNETEYQLPTKKPLRIGFYTTDGFFDPQPAIQRAVEEAVEAMQARGHTCGRFDPPEVTEAVASYYGVMAADGAFRNMIEGLAGEELWTDYKKLHTMAKMPKLLRPLVSRLLSALGWRRLAAINSAGGSKTAYEYQELTSWLVSYQSRFIAAMNEQNIDAIICPGLAVPALPHGMSKDLTPACSYTLLYNLLKFPAGTVPVTKVRADPNDEEYAGRQRDPLFAKASAACAGSAGCPVGVQVVTRPFRDELCLGAMAELEAGLTR